MNRLPREGKIGYAKFLVLPLVLAVLLSVGLTACGAGESPTATPAPTATATAQPPQFDGQRAYADVQAQVAFGPRPSGTEALALTRDYIVQQLQQAGWAVSTQSFEYQGILVQNVFARNPGDDSVKPMLLIGAHFDTRPQADRESDPARRAQPILGANDGASGVAVLLEFARVYNPARSGQAVILAFFDAEDRGGIDGWPFSVGAEGAAQQLGPELDAAIIVDMIGDADQQIYWEGNSDAAMQQDLWEIAARLGYGAQFIPTAEYALADDHIPFLQRGIPAVDIIDFDYPYWHTLQDTADKVSADSLERVGRVLLEYVYTR